MMNSLEISPVMILYPRMLKSSTANSSTRLLAKQTPTGNER